jgi:hypothetical protein
VTTYVCIHAVRGRACARARVCVCVCVYYYTEEMLRYFMSRPVRLTYIPAWRIRRRHGLSGDTSLGCSEMNAYIVGNISETLKRNIEHGFQCVIFMNNIVLVSN